MSKDLVPFTQCKASGESMKKKPPKLSLITMSEEYWDKVSEELNSEIHSMVARLSLEELELALERVEQLAEEYKSPSRHRKARKKIIRTERAGKIKRIK